MGKKQGLKEVLNDLRKLIYNPRTTCKYIIKKSLKMEKKYVLEELFCSLNQNKSLNLVSVVRNAIHQIGILRINKQSLK